VPLQQRRHAAQEHLLHEWLGQEVGRPGAEDAPQVVRPLQRAQHQHRQAAQRGVGADGAAQGVAVHVRHDVIRDHQLHPVGIAPQQRQRLLSVAHLHGFHAELPQRGADDAPHQRTVVRHQRPQARARRRPQQRLHRPAHGARLEGLDDEVRRAGPEALHAPGQRIVRRHEHDGHAAVRDIVLHQLQRADAPAGFEAVDARHVHVQRHQAGPFRGQPIQPVLTRAGFEHLAAGRLQFVTDQAACDRAVIHREDLHGHPPLTVRCADAPPMQLHRSKQTSE
jgi:hypothetical protein